MFNRINYATQRIKHEIRWRIYRFWDTVWKKTWDLSDWLYFKAKRENIAEEILNFNDRYIKTRMEASRARWVAD